ncbi:MAG TPA: lanthionine synthetase LanC family protein [Chitinophaga sp.]|uniref:lanthionine synthetase LanC family protein n=1 Tax=Chitinophaga sp. TaxID=1869181 RepID=UPI002BC2BF8C|nr:lanthionine synthetase LanC family protein [Chitinophaga sp.]HVI45568.1 lanthionine synthetase LanC family protein [Chitinophaga sp.]
MSKTSSLRKEYYLREAGRVAQDLLNMAGDGQELYWESLTERDDALYLYRAADIYSGNAGIALFWCELYQLTGDEKYRSTLIKILTALYEQPMPAGISLYTGRAGLIYCYARCGIVLKEDDWIGRAAAIAETIGHDFDKAPDDFSVAELTGGISGTLWAITYLYDLRPSAWALRLVARLAEKLIALASITKEGIFWDKEPHQVKGLCGMAHGVAGIAHVLNNVGHYFNNEGLLLLADMAFAYEDAHYNSTAAGWPDFRLGMYNDTYREFLFKAYEENDHAAFRTGGYMNAWCHGAPGAGLARCYYKSARGAVRYNRMLKQIADHITHQQASTAKTFTLCHGTGSQIEFLLSYMESTGKSTYREYISDVVAAYLDENTSPEQRYRSGFEGSGQYDASLMNGVAGIGYLFLRLHSTSVPSMLLPVIRSSVDNGQDEACLGKIINPESVMDRLLDRCFPATGRILHMRNKAGLAAHYTSENKRIKVSRRLPAGIKSMLEECSPEERFEIRTEHALQCAGFNIRSHIYEYVRQLANQLQVTNMKDCAPENIWLTRDTSVKIMYDKDTARHVALTVSWQGARMIVLEKLAFYICGFVATPTNLAGVTGYIQEITASPAGYHASLQQIVLDQVIHLVRQGILNCKIIQSR